MRSIETKITRVIVGKIEPDEDLINSIIDLVKKYNIKSGIVNCIGALKKITIGYFDIESKEYLTRTIEEYVELVSCIGNITFIDGNPIIHLHASIGARDYSIIGGHLIQPTIVSITGEIYILEVDKKIKRATNPQFSLSLLAI
ncbi:MAG: DNA-binding protein [Promethearchaeota archaeon]|nr:MAG: DNA-binding protein [Candidatus Lokiarchaeota archaeon]